MFNKIFVANRGEIAVRLIQVIHELGASAIVGYAEPDVDSLAVALADTAVCIGPGPAAQSYLNMQNILAAAVLTGAEAIHPGFGFLSENSDFAELCEQAGIVFIGPSALTIKQLGDKAQARALAAKFAVPVIPGSEALHELAQAQIAAGQIGYPLMLKAAAGGGGKGIRKIADEAALSALWQPAQQEAMAAFADDSMYLEKVLTAAKHIEVQVLGDQAGHVWVFPERDCSLQKAKQKLIEISPCLQLSPARRKQLQAYAQRLAQGVGYVNAGTIEFLVDEAGVYFMEMNTRIQVEHPISECVTGVDLLRWQIMIAAGMPLTQGDRVLPAQGVAIECRINAQANGARDQITQIRWPLGGAGVRIDTGIKVGTRLSPYYDAMLAKLIVHADSAPLAWQRMQRALKEFKIQGVTTNVAAQLNLIAKPTVQTGAATITYVEDNDAQTTTNSLR
ncbi:acetyl-CoA carboxylase biotin carboxylase subunit [Lacticaseibacillus jixiensis]|uniref:acetyl-CoA carboxylase biotin carboxylase subunit n=1 Tax=Lacticaseibacillus jixiensis TaxID=3231926 RepID=UPI0036F2943B